MDNQFYPSNGTEGAIFMDEFCDRCYKRYGCTILLKTLVGEAVKQWIYDDNGDAICTSFSAKAPGKTKRVHKSQLSIFKK